MIKYLATQFRRHAFACTLSLACFSSALLSTPAGAEQGSTADPLKMFGVSLKGAKRSVLEKTLAKVGFTPYKGHVGPQYLKDIYVVHGQLTGAYRLIVAYLPWNNRFAFAQYMFKTPRAEMPMVAIFKLEEKVISKYGKPIPTLNNDFSDYLKTAVDTWEVGSGMAVKVIHKSEQDLSTVQGYIYLLRLEDTVARQEVLAYYKSKGLIKPPPPPQPAHQPQVPQGNAF